MNILNKAYIRRIAIIVLISIILALHIIPQTSVDAKSEVCIVDEELNLFVFDVGQASSCLIVAPNGKTMLIDASSKSSSKKLIADIKKLGVECIDVLIGTHPHSDHIGGFLEIHKAFDVKEVRMPKVAHTSKTFQNILEYYAKNNIKVRTLVGGSDKFIPLDDDISVQVIAPNSSKYKKLNDYSGAFRIVYGENSILIMGDNEEISENEILSKDYELSSEVLVVAHHGSKTSSTWKFLNEVKPEVAIISLGKNNSYGHPHSTTINRLKRLNANIYRTDKDGIVAAFFDGKTYSLKCEN